MAVRHGCGSRCADGRGSRCALFLVLLVVVQACSAAILAIDYGTQWTKAALVKPGIPIDVVLTRDSKRKEQTVITFKGDERLYGSDAFGMGARFPETTFTDLKRLLGQPFGGSDPQSYRLLHRGIVLNESEHGSVALAVNANETFLVEELVAMQLSNIRASAERMAGERIYDVVITVPAFATERERQALLDAAHIANLHVLSLIEDGTAVALNFATLKTFTENKQYHMIYDMGAGSTTATLVSFLTKSVFDQGKNKTVSILSIDGIGYDRGLGGDAMDAALTRYMLEKFEAKHGSKGIRNNNRALFRLRKEASRVKQILSANVETSASIEGLHDDIDFRLTISRTQFLNLCSELTDRVTQPIIDALEQGDKKIDDVESIILAGGAIRTPFVQEELKSFAGDSKLSKNVNADESAVMGAVFRGAVLSKQYKVKDYRVLERIRETILLRYKTENETDEDEHWLENSTILFKEGEQLGMNKHVIFERTTDFICHLYDDNEQYLKSYNLSGVASAITKLESEYGCKTKLTVEAQVVYGSSGVINLLDARAGCEVEIMETFTLTPTSTTGSTSSTHGGYWKNLFKKQKTGNTSAAATATVDNTTTESNLTDSHLDSTDEARTSITLVPVLKFKHETITANPLYPTVQTLGVETIISAQGRLAALDRKDNERFARDDARNKLETYVYRSKEYLQDETLKRLSTLTEITDFTKALDEISVWMYDEGETASLSDISNKFEKLKRLENEIIRKLELMFKVNSKSTKAAGSSTETVSTTSSTTAFTSDSSSTSSAESTRAQVPERDEL